MMLDTPFERVDVPWYGGTRRYCLYAEQTLEGAWRWTVGHWEPYDHGLQAAESGYWIPDVTGLTATEGRAQSQARAAVTTVIEPKAPWSCPDWAVPR